MNYLAAPAMGLLFVMALIAPKLGQDLAAQLPRLTFEVGALNPDNYQYASNGVSLEHVGSTSNNFQFQGEDLDSDLGMVFLRARWMNPQRGTFIDMDSFEGVNIDPHSFHKYSFANSDSGVNRNDPSGHFSILEAGIAVGVIGALVNIAIPKYFASRVTNPTGTRIFVNIWPFLGSDQAWGHASMTIEGPNTAYISWWPETGADEPKISTRDIRALGRLHAEFLNLGDICTAPAIRGRTFDQDKGAEFGQEPERIDVSRLDSGKMLNWWSQWQSTVTYWSTFGPNCSSVVLEALKAGGATPLELVGTPSVVTPNLVARVARRISR